MGEDKIIRDETQPLRQRKPFNLRIMLWVYVLWTLLGWVRFTAALYDRELILGLISPGLHFHLVAAGLFWGLAGLPVLWGILRRTSWVSPLIVGTGILYPTIYWFERLVLWQDPDSKGNWPFMLLLTLLWFGLIFWVLRSKQVRQYFNGSSIKGK